LLVALRLPAAALLAGLALAGLTLFIGLSPFSILTLG
jgi:hypothetical protein